MNRGNFLKHHFQVEVAIESDGVYYQHFGIRTFAMQFGASNQVRAGLVVKLTIGQQKDGIRLHVQGATD